MSVNKFAPADIWRRKVQQWREQLPEIEGKDLFDFLKHRLYLTGLYTAVLITLLRYSHRPDGWGDLAMSFDTCAANSDLVLRHDWGEAFASIWGDASRRKEIEDELERMRTENASPEQPELVAYLREIARYALKHLWGDDMQPAHAGAADSTHGLGHYRADVIRDYGGEKDGYSSPTDRMIATELLLAHAIAHDDANPLTDLTDLLFRPKWDYHLCDMLDLGYVVAARNEESLRRYRESPDAFPGPQLVRERCSRNHREVLDMGSKLRNSEFARRHPGLAELLESGPGGARSYQLQLLSANTDLESRIRSLDHELEELCRSKSLPQDGEARNGSLDAIKVLLSHPLWNVTEIVTTALTDMSWGWPPSTQARLIDSLLDPGNWKVRYGAVDLAFNLGERSGHDYAHFVRMVLHLHARNETQCRVVGLMTEEVLSWLSNPWSGPDAQGRLDSGDHDETMLRSMITSWVGKPAGVTSPDGWQRDSWQLENIYLLFSMLKDKNPQLMNKLLPRGQEDWNPVLLGDQPFYQLGHTAFLRRIESNWTGPALGTGAL